jgi:hypothetical protein
MSLDVTLLSPNKERKTCFECGSQYDYQKSLFSSNITHNLGDMAEEAGIYKHLWRPEELGITKAEDLIRPIMDGLKMMKDDPERFEKFDSPNGWGRYMDFVPWIEEYLAACIQYPDAIIHVSR